MAFHILMYDFTYVQSFINFFYTWKINDLSEIETS